MKLEDLNKKSFSEKIKYLQDLESFLGDDIPVYLMFHGIEVEVQLEEEFYGGTRWYIESDGDGPEGYIEGPYDFKFFTSNAEVEME